MKITFIEIRNFRKLESCRIDLGNQNTVLVGANNSGKTSAMSALLRFLKKRRLVLDDFTITNLPVLNQIGQKIIAANPDDAVTSDDWDMVLPFVDVWLDVKSDELRYVGEIIPTLDWTEGLLGVRLVYEPKDQDKLYSAYASAYQMSHEGNAGLKLWPVDFVDFLGEKIGAFFTINAYPLDPAKVVEPEQCGVANPQTLATEVAPFGFDPFKHIIRIDAITAQRGFEDADDKAYLREKLEKRIEENQSKQLTGKPSSQAYKDRAKKIEKDTARLRNLSSIKQFAYNPEGNNTEKNSLDHAEVIKICAHLLHTKSTFRAILVDKYPIILIDESQDTTKVLMDVFLEIEALNRGKLTLGLFGDTMQRIYLDGKDKIADSVPTEWEKPQKEMNHRSRKRIVDLCNAIRADADGIEQISRHDKPDGIVRATPHKCQKPHYTVGAK